MREAEVVRQDPELLEEIASGPEPVADLAPQLAGAVEHAVEGEREPVEHREQLGEAVGAVAEVGFEIVAVARQLPRFVSSGKHRNLRVEGGRGLGSKRPDAPERFPEQRGDSCGRLARGGLRLPRAVVPQQGVDEGEQLRMSATRAALCSRPLATRRS